jgi:hypothetical protein
MWANQVLIKDHGAMSMQPDEIAAAEALTLLDAGTVILFILPI